MIIDFHTHAFTDSLAERAITSLSKASNIEAYTDGTINGLIDFMHRNNIDISVVLPVATRVSQVDNINKWAQSINSKKCIAFGAIHPDCENYYDILKDLKINGFKGIKLHPEYQSFYVDDKKMFPVYETLQGLDLIIVLHAGVDLGFSPPVHCTPDRLKRVADTFPHLKIVAAHMGGYKLWGDVIELLPETNIWLDTSYSREIDSDMYKALLNNFNNEKILFGSDCPWENASDTLRNLYSLNLSSELMDKILYKNAAALLDLNIK